MLTSEDRAEIKQWIADALSAPKDAISAAEAEDSHLLAPVIDITARAVEVFGSRGKALRWLRTPVRSLGNRTPVSLLSSSEGIVRVKDCLGRVEHGVW